MVQESRRRLFDEEPTPASSPLPGSRRLPFADDTAQASAPAPVSHSQSHARDAGLFPPRTTASPRAASDGPGLRVQPLIALAMEKAKAQYSELVAANEARFRRKLEQLQNWDLKTVVGWGVDAAGQQANLASRVADHVRDFGILDASGKLQATVKELSAPLTLFERMKGVTRNVDLARLHLAGVKNGVLGMQPLNTKFLEEQEALKGELLMLVGALSIAAEVFGEPEDMTVGQALDQRRRSLHMSAKQSASLRDSLEEMGGLMIRQAGDIDHALHVTLTNLKLAQANQS